MSQQLYYLKNLRCGESPRDILCKNEGEGTSKRDSVTEKYFSSFLWKSGGKSISSAEKPASFCGAENTTRKKGFFRLLIFIVSK